MSEVPPFPWHTLGTDLLYWKHQDLLVIASYFFQVSYHQVTSKFHSTGSHQGTFHDHR